MDPKIWEILLYFVLTAIATFFLIRVIRFILRRIYLRMNRGDKIRFDPTSYSFIQNAISFLFILIAFILFVFGIPELRTYGEKIFVGAGLLTIAIGFASQAALSNIIGGIFIVMFRPFRVNDIISVNQNLGIVEDITLRHTVIRNFENRRIVIPNSVISSETILNSSIEDSKICNFLEVSVGYSSDIEKAMATIREEALQHPFCIDNRTPEEIEEGKPQVAVRIINWLDSGVLIRANIWTQDQPSGFQLKCDLFQSLIKRFGEENIEIPFPHRVIIEK
jgi:small-conductance mechanosensitive channel